MNQNTLKAAVKRLMPEGQDVTNQELKEALIEKIMADDKGFTAGEAEEIYQAMLAEAAGQTISSANSDTTTEVSSTGPYTQYDLWQVDPTKEERKQGDTTINVITKYTAVKKLREDVRIEPSVAKALNAQTHNSGRRYYASGTVTNGHEENIDIEHL